MVIHPSIGFNIPIVMIPNIGWMTIAHKTNVLTMAHICLGLWDLCRVVVHVCAWGELTSYDPRDDHQVVINLSHDPWLNTLLPHIAGLVSYLLSEMNHQVTI